jgi:hypothetical protein
MNKKYKIELTAEECLSIQNLLEKELRNTSVISAREEIEKLLSKFRG